jgi:hypothetical protein
LARCLVRRIAAVQRLGNLRLQIINLGELDPDDVKVTLFEGTQLDPHQRLAAGAERRDDHSMRPGRSPCGPRNGSLLLNG